MNGPRGTRPSYELRPPNDITPPNEYEICFKCHSSYIDLTPSQPDLAVLTNPNNTSYHPIQARGRNLNIDSNAFEAGWSSEAFVSCSHCHESHGSSYDHLVKKPKADLCFDCHRRDVYGNAASDAATQRASRFNDPNGRGHSYHVDSQMIACQTCHVVLTRSSTAARRYSSSSVPPSSLFIVLR